MLISTNPTPDGNHRSPQIQLWATFLGVSSAALAALQYAPQIAHTFRLKLVGALSIPMMCLQTPGAVIMVLSIALPPGTDWTRESLTLPPPSGHRADATPRAAWISYTVAGIMQGVLVMCLVFRARQHAAGLDDFGRPLHSASLSASATSTLAIEVTADEAVQTDVPAGPEPASDASESAPLLPKQNGSGSGSSERRKGVFGWLKR